MYFRYSGEICQNGNYLEGNAGMFSGDVVTIEINMDTIPRTICLFINGHQQPNFMANIPASVRPYFTIYQIGDSVTVLSLKRCTEPSIATLTQKKNDRKLRITEKKFFNKRNLDLINMSETFGENCIICSEIPAKTSFGELQTFAAQFGEIRKLWLEEPNGKETRQALVFFTTEQDLEKATSKKLHFFNGEYIENITEDYKKAIQTIYDQGIIEDIKIIFNRVEKERETIKEIDGIWPKVTADNLLCTKYACEILYHIASADPIATNESIPQGKVCSSHTRTIKKLIDCSELDIKEQLQRKNTLQILSQLLQHSNLEVKSDSMSSIKSLIYRPERGMQKRFRCDKPLVKDLEEQIYFISLNCLINGETDVMKNEAAIVIGQFN
ncbi:MAG: hypothetical protein EZS28_032089 [Streblomastix strix]|uniref:RRM domain-containing protein n=1 Tax=Streblomastix strix TaxID=222440 RepID=A0A5J4UQB4_9EUKA|nr:MAG: hypothetical protein EZS28_032089 [Streblomastix strix]